MEFTPSLKEQLQEALRAATGPVQLKVFIGDEPSEESTQVRDLLRGIQDLRPNIYLEEGTTGEGILRYPAIQITSPGATSNYTYYGSPGGHEFSSLVEAIRTVAIGSSDLDEQLVKKIQGISAPIQIEIFVTPSCSFCPAMVIAAFRISRLNPKIQVNIVEATSFRSYARGKGVMGVPKTLINETQEIQGSVPIEEFVDKLLNL